MLTERSIVMVSIIIIQSNQFAIKMCREQLGVVGFAEGEDFFLTNNPQDAEPYVVANTPQLLVSGTFNGDNQAAADFARKMRSKNRALSTLSFSVSEMRGFPWDDSITKATTDGFCDQLITKLRAFLDRVPTKV